MKYLKGILALFFILISLLGCSGKKEFRYGLWLGGNFEKTDSAWAKAMDEFKDAGITDLFVAGSKSRLESLVKYGEERDIKIHAWMWVMNRPNDSTVMKHPSWYSVNKLGINSFEARPYVNHYQWVSPFVPEARKYILGKISETAAIEGIESVHLDYIRYCDVILGKPLQKKYNINQTKELPEYDFGYHPIARQEFKAQFGYDPVNLESPETDVDWLQFRLDAITSFVSEIYDEVHKSGVKLSAAVFPYPELARQHVRQDWSNWDLDIALPMIYHNFYGRDIQWIKFATEKSLRESKNSISVMPGVFLPAMNSSQLSDVIEMLKQTDAIGICMFGYGKNRSELLEVIRNSSQK